MGSTCSLPGNHSTPRKGRLLGCCISRVPTHEWLATLRVLRRAIALSRGTRAAISARCFGKSVSFVTPATAADRVSQDLVGADRLL